MIVVTTPTGNIGHQVLNNILGSDEPMRVIARDPAKLPDEVREQVEVVQGSQDDPQVLARAFNGADTLFWVLPIDYQAASAEETFVEFTRPASAAIRNQGVKRVVGVSALGRTTPYADRAGFVTASLAMNDLITSTGVAFRALSMPGFMDNLLGQARVISQRGAFFNVVSPDRALPAVATCDIATVATRLLLDNTWTGQEEVPVLGPEDLSFNDMAAVISEVLGAPVRYQQIPGGTFKEQLVKSGLSGPMAEALLEMMLAKDLGLDNGITRTRQNAIDTPTTFRQWCEEALKPAVLAEAA